MIENIFIVGTGRSGTHFLCRSLLDFENINDTLNGIEDPKLLKEVTIASLMHNELPTSVIQKYNHRLKKCRETNKIFLDQHHPTIHNVKQLNEEFPNSIFLGIDRPTEQIVASMLMHSGVLKWFRSARKNSIPYPNRFLGVNSLTEIQNTSLHMLCTKRVVAHKKLNNSLLSLKNFKLINFENFILNKQQELYNAFGSDLLNFGKLKEKEIPNHSVLHKYKNILSKKQIIEIQDYEALHLN